MTKKSLFLTPDGQRVLFTFVLVSSLFLLWGFCNGLIDVMDKHFQDELGLTKAQSAWVQFAHYLGYFLMAVPAGWLAEQARLQGRHHRRAADRGGRRLLVHARDHDQPDGAGGQRVARRLAFVAFLAGVCLIATGLTFLETIANPVHHGARRPALRGHAHQSGAVVQRHRLDLRADRRQHVSSTPPTPPGAARAARRSTFRTRRLRSS